jgi:hypothetical protein
VKNTILFVLLLFLAGLFTACDDSSDYIYETHEVFYIDNCKKSVSLRQSPSTTAKVLVKVKKNTKLDQVIPFNEEWHKVTLTSGETGYILSKYISSKIEKERVRRKNDRDDLEEEGQTLALSIIDWYEGDGRTKSNFPHWLSIVVSILTFVVGWFGWKHLSDEAIVPIWVTYMLTLFNSGLLTYIIFYGEASSLDVHWLIGILFLGLFLFAVALLWVNLLGLTVELLDGSDYAYYHVLSNVVAVIVTMICGYWIEGSTDIVIILAILLNVVFFVLYLVEAIKSGQLSGYFATLFLWIICIVPTIAFTVIALEIIFALVCCLFVISAILSGGGRSSSSRSSSSDDSYSSSSSCDSDVDTYSTVYLPGEITGRRIKHHNDWSGRDDCGDEWEKNWDGTWSKK